jgi:hypothetical protein
MVDDRCGEVLTVDDLGDGVLGQVDNQIGILGGLVVQI